MHLQMHCCPFRENGQHRHRRKSTWIEWKWNFCEMFAVFAALHSWINAWNQVEKNVLFGLKISFFGGTEMQFLMYSIFFRAVWTSLFDLQPQRCCYQVPLSKMMSNYFRKPNWASHFSFGASDGSLIIGPNRAIERRHWDFHL